MWSWRQPWPPKEWPPGWERWEDQLETLQQWDQSIKPSFKAEVRHEGGEILFPSPDLLKIQLRPFPGNLFPLGNGIAHA